MAGEVRSPQGTAEGWQDGVVDQTRDRLALENHNKMASARYLARAPGDGAQSNDASSFGDYSAKRWAEGHKSARHLVPELKAPGYAGSQIHLERLLGQWRRADHAGFLKDLAGDNTAIALPEVLPLPPIPAASLCIKLTKLLTDEQSAQVTQLKRASPSFATMRGLAMRFRGILRGKDPDRLDDWMNDARSSGLHGIRRFVLTLRNDMAAVRNTIRERWSNGQVEGQINRLKTVKRCMYGRANTDLLRARPLPLHLPTL
jgi:transposase